MAEKWTPQQEMAVKNRGGKLLVSAAAGSGKTKVLVDRLLDYMTAPADPANIDEFLIITYTKAAASELRGKIAAKLTERIAEDPDNRHLQRQLQRLYLAKISTVHAFCTDILREYAWQLELPGDFRVAEETECAQLRLDTLNRLLDRVYADMEPDIAAFVDTQGLGRDDRLVPQILLKVYDSARCHLNPDAWLDACLENASVEGCDDAAQTVWGGYLLADLKSYVNLQIQAFQNCITQAEGLDTMEKPVQLLKDTLYQLQALANCETWDAVVQKQTIDYGRLTFSKKCPDPTLAEGIKAVRNACKTGLAKKLRAFADESSVVLEDMRRSAPAVRGMTELVRRFAREYDRAKAARRILDFSDLEHRALDLLWGKRRQAPTALASEIGSRFREIMVDEYQDSNAVQDAIFTALTKDRGNCFLVGDVKQSIYQFRLADPGIFLEKYNRFADAEAAQPGEGRKVLLSSNFRSGGGVLRSVNDIFKLTMTEAVGDLDYTDAEALSEGIPHIPLGEPEVELLALEARESTYREEAELVADRVAKLLDGTHSVRQGDALRDVQPEDIAILLRSPGSVGREFTKALARRGIRCVTGGGEDLLKTEEGRVLRALLQTVSNPRQDIPLIAVLASPLFGFTADDLAALRKGKRKMAVYDALLSWEHPKARHFLNILEALRREARMKTLAQLLEAVLRLTAMDRIYGAMADGALRKENLQALYTLASNFEATGHRDLTQFLEFLDTVEEKGLMTAQEQTAPGAVTLMSIHKSKGLEFPVVIVAGLSREFNRESIRAQVLCHRELGLGLSAVDAKNRVRYPTVAKRAIALKLTRESLSEELRVLYVALTRARDRLVMTYASNTLDDDLAYIVSRSGLSHRELLTSEAVCPGQWVLMAALQRTEAGELFARGGYPGETTPGDPAWHIQVVDAPGEGPAVQTEEAPRQSLTEEEEAALARNLAFRYPWEAATQAPSKQTATQRKGREKDAEAAEHAPQSARQSHPWRKPAGADPREAGTAMHLAMQHLPWQRCEDPDAIRRELEILTNQGFLTPEQEKIVDIRKISAFFASELGQKLRTGQVLREFKFSILEDGGQEDPALAGEQILLQGVVDCALLEDDGITVVDFKTDYVTEATLPDKVRRYRPQVLSYAGALRRIYGRPVKASYLYFFHMDRLEPVV